MRFPDIRRYLEGNPYPGRGIVLGRSSDGKAAVIVYFIMGRSDNSRNRVFVETEDGIMTRALNPAKMTDPSLIIYRPVRFACGYAIVSNGDQTDTIVDAMPEDGFFIRALRTRTFEPDKPHYTPRISGMVAPDGKYALSILKSLGGDGFCCCRQFFEYDSPAPGVGHLIHTYSGDGEVLPSFEGEPRAVAVCGDIGRFAEDVWEALDPENRVSLYACRIEIPSGRRESVIINKNSGRGGPA